MFILRLGVNGKDQNYVWNLDNTFYWNWQQNVVCGTINECLQKLTLNLYFYAMVHCCKWKMTFFLYMRGFVDCYTSWMVKGKGRLLELQCLFHTDLLEPRGWIFMQGIVEVNHKWGFKTSAVFSIGSSIRGLSTAALIKQKFSL